MGTIIKTKQGKEDSHLWGGTSTKTSSRTTSEGYAMTLHHLDWMGIDVFQKYGGGVNQNSVAIAAALVAIAAVTDPLQLWLAPGTWSLSQSHTFGANVILAVAPGAIIDTDMSIRSATYKWTRSGSGDPDAQAAGYVLAAYNLTINGDLIAPNCKIMTGYGEINVERLDTEDVSTSGTGEDNLASSSVPAGFLGTTGGIRVRAAGTKTLSNGNKTIKFHWGSTAFTVHPPDNNIRDWQFDAEIWNTGYATQKIRWRFVDGDRDVMAHYAGYETATEDTSAAVTIKMTGECAHASDTITQTLWRRGRIT